MAISPVAQRGSECQVLYIWCHIHFTFDREWSLPFHSLLREGEEAPRGVRKTLRLTTSLHGLDGTQ